jgi:hypothetical protein
MTGPQLRRLSPKHGHCLIKDELLELQLFWVNLAPKIKKLKTLDKGL